MKVFRDVNGKLYAFERAKSALDSYMPIVSAELLAVLDAAPITQDEADRRIVALRDNPVTEIANEQLEIPA